MTLSPNIFKPMPGLGKRDALAFWGAGMGAGSGFGNRTGMGAYLGANNPRTTGAMNVTDAINSGGQVMQWLPSTGVGPGTRGYRGSGVLGSASGVVGSKGMPTSQRGRFERFGPEAAGMPTWEAAGIAQSGFGGLKEIFGNLPRSQMFPAASVPVTSKPTQSKPLPQMNRSLPPPVVSAGSNVFPSMGAMPWDDSELFKLFQGVNGAMSQNSTRDPGFTDRETFTHNQSDESFRRYLEDEIADPRIGNKDWYKRYLNHVDSEKMRPGGGLSGIFKQIFNQ